MFDFRLYLCPALGWETQERAKVAISQARDNGEICNKTCPKLQLLKNDGYREGNNLIKFLGYIPLVNVVAGFIAMTGASENGFWALRGVAMILTGPLLAIADLSIFIFDCIIVEKYRREHVEIMEQFNHNHSIKYFWGTSVTTRVRVGEELCRW